MKAKKPYSKKKKRVGRGPGSGRGKTSTRGHKGQMSRSGAKRKPGFEGGQMPLYRRVPKRGFNNIFRKEYAVINLERLEGLGIKEINPEVLVDKGVLKGISKFAGIKILGNGEIKSALTVSAHKFSGSAKEKIEKGGGKAIVLEKKVGKPKQDKPKEGDNVSSAS